MWEPWLLPPVFRGRPGLRAELPSVAKGLRRDPDLFPSPHLLHAVLQTGDALSGLWSQQCFPLAAA